MNVRTMLAATVLVLSAAACTRPPEPPTDDPPEPQARGSDATESHDAIQAPIQKAEAVEGAVLDAAAKQRADIEAQTGG
ncbi:hypothetical protein [Luteimonas vadosa]|uniref:Secreted protein n=1 Tax=Luteimonas vadosa TaxID=1165507 RepID=A0ABP9DTA2_9GAMM